MRVIKPLQQGLLCRTLVKDKRFYLSVASLSYFPFHNPIALGAEVDMWNTISNTCGPEAVFDACLPKVSSEVLMAGRCYAPNGAPTDRLFVDLDIGPIIKRIVVTGDRYWKRGEVGENVLSRMVGRDWEASAPKPFVEMDIGWKNAFGGEGYEYNPLGKGYIPADQDPSFDHTSMLPNVEGPELLVSNPRSYVHPAGYGPIDACWPQRAEKIGKKYGKKWEKERFPEPAVDMKPNYYNAALEDQQLKEGFWNGDEKFVITNMHADKPVLESTLPQVRPRCFALQSGGPAERWTEIDLYPETVWLFPNVERGVLISRGLFEIDTFYGVDVDVLLLVWELKKGRTRAPEDYRKSVAVRMDDETSGDWLAREDDLSPPEGIPEEEPIFLEEEDSSSDAEPLIKRAKQEVDGFLKSVKDKAAELGVDASKYLSGISFPPIVIPTPPKFEKLSDVPKMMEWAKAQDAKMDAEVAKIKQETKFYGETKEEAKAKIEAKSREICEMCGQDYDELMAKQAQNPPPTTSECFDKLSGVLVATRNEVAESTDSPFKPPGAPDKAAKLAVLDDMIGKNEVMKAEMEAVDEDPEIKAMELAVSHLCEPPERPSDEVLAKRREWVQQQHKNGEGCEGADLCYVDLSDLALPGLNLKGATLDGAVLNATDLTGADLTETVLARVEGANALLVEANLTSANLGKSNFNGADFTGAKLEDVILEETNFVGSKFVKSTIKCDMCSESTFDDADLSEAVMIELDSVESNFNRTIFNGADLTKASFMECQLVAADFSRAVMEETSFTNVVATHAVFKEAKMLNTNIHSESNFTGADFSYVESDGLNFGSTNLSDAIFERANLHEADFGESTLIGANLERAVARESNFTDADLSRANFHGADLMNASLQGAIMAETNFTYAHLFEADLLFADTGTAYFEGAVMKRTLLSEK